MDVSRHLTSLTEHMKLSLDYIIVMPQRKVTERMVVFGDDRWGGGEKAGALEEVRKVIITFLQYTQCVRHCKRVKNWSDKFN